MCVISWARQINELFHVLKRLHCACLIPLTCIHLLLLYAARNGAELDVRTSLNLRTLKANLAADKPCKHQQLFLRYTEAPPFLINLN
jgi:hypothetical protein